jgi:fatty-acyl-CoA synthase
VATDEQDPLAWSSTGAAFAAVAGRRPDAAALRWREGDALLDMSYAELLRRARTLASSLLEDHAPGDRLALWSANCPEWVVALLGCALSGIVLVPLNPALTVPEAQFIVAASGSATVLAGPPWRGRDLAAGAAELRVDDRAVRVRPLVGPTPSADATATDPDLPPVSAQNLLLVQYTSGTTGTPKGAMLSHLVATNVGPLSHRALGLTEHDVVCSPLPFHHVGGSICTVLATLLIGGTYVVLPQFEAVETLAMLAEAEVTFFGGVPTMLIAMLEVVGGRAPNVARLRRVMVGGTTVSPALIDRVEREFGIEVMNGYGQSEAPSALQTRPGDTALVKATTIGRANVHREIAILDPTNAAAHVDLPAGSVGELCLRGPLTMSGYWEERDLERSSAVDADGWLHTGDLASRDADGVVTLHGRLREVIIRGGENIYPAEVESALVTHPDVADIAVVGVPDPRWGEVPAAFVRTASGRLDPDDLEAFALGRLASFKVPRIWRQVSDFPLTACGKVQRFRLAEQFAAE